MPARLGTRDRKVHLAPSVYLADLPRLAVLIDYPASPGCTPPYAPIWIAEMVRRREA